jgi:hypothetical protein
MLLRHCSWQEWKYWNIMETSWNVMLHSLMYRYWWSVGTAPTITNAEDGNSRFFCNTGRMHLKCDDTRTETTFRLSAKRTSPFKSAGASVQSTTGSRGVSISGSNAGYTMFCGSVKSTGYPLHLPVSPPCVTVCHHISTGLYLSTKLLHFSLSCETGTSWLQSAATKCIVYHKFASHISWQRLTSCRKKLQNTTWCALLHNNDITMF